MGDFAYYQESAMELKTVRVFCLCKMRKVKLKKVLKIEKEKSSRFSRGVKKNREN